MLTWGCERPSRKGCPGPRLVVATKAIVATGTYGPKGFAPECGCTPLGAEEADGIDSLTRVVRDQIRRGADWIKVYADIGWGPHGESRPTFTLDELKLVVDVAESSGRHVAAHASTAEGMRRAALAGVRTIEHGDGGAAEVFALMAERGVALCPTIAAYEAIISYGAGGLGGEPFTPESEQKYRSMRRRIRAWRRRPRARGPRSLRHVSSASLGVRDRRCGGNPRSPG